MSMDLKIFGFNLRVINVYAPTESGSSNEKDVFYRSIKKACVKRQKNQKLIVLGDFNAKTSLAAKKCCFDGTNIIDDISNDNGTRMKSFCRENRLCIASSFFEYTAEQRYTWYSCDKKTTNINDYVLPEHYVQQFITDCIAKPDFDFDSDHRILVTHLRTPMTRKARWQPRQKRNQIQKRPNLKALQDEKIKTDFCVAVRNELNNETGRTSTEISDKLIECLKTAGNSVLPPSTKRTAYNEIWKDDVELNRIIDKRKSIERDSENYKKLTKLLKKRVNHLRNEKLAKEADEINEHATRREVENLYRCMKTVSNTFAEVKRKKKCDPSLLKSHFMKHFNPAPSTEDPIEFTQGPDLQEVSTDEIKIGPPDRGELLATIKTLKNGKAANDVPAIYIKCALSCENMLIEMVKLYATVWETNVIPTKWGHSKLVSLWKGSSKGSIEDPEAYRALQIGSSFCKIMIVIIINRLKTWYDQQLLDQQQGFRSGRGTVDAIYRIKRVHQITNRMKVPVYTLFIDLSAAFDHVDRKWLFKSIRQRLPEGWNAKLFQLLESLYHYTTTALAEAEDDIFELTSGVRQGGPESPILYNLFMDYVMRVFLDTCKEKGVSFFKLKYKIPSTASQNGRIAVGYHVIDWIGYADDLALCFAKKSDLQLAINELHSTFKRFRLSINISKTKTMILNQQHCNTEYPSTICNLEGSKIENVTLFRYLGPQIKYDEASTGDSELDLRIDSSESKFYEVGKKILNFRIAITTRTKVLNALVRSRLSYACQAWTLTAGQLQRLSSCYNSMLRKMFKGGFRRKENSWSFKHTNDDLIAKCNTEKMEQFIARQQRNFTCHVIRMGNTNTTKRLMFNNDVSRTPGRDVTLYTNVLRNENITPEELNESALLRKY